VGVQFDKARFERLLDEPLKCNVCGATQKNLPALKGHILSHA
jgi:hypothetical protein